MLVNILIAIIVIMSAFVFILLYLTICIYKKYVVLTKGTANLNHDITSSLKIFSLTIESLKELVPSKQKNFEESNISLADLPVLIEILDEAERSIFCSINRWNV